MISMRFAVSLFSDAEFPFNEERVIPDGVNRDSAIIGGTKCLHRISAVNQIIKWAEAAKVKNH